MGSAASACQQQLLSHVIDQNVITSPTYETLNQYPFTLIDHSSKTGK